MNLTFHKESTFTESIYVSDLLNKYYFTNNKGQDIAVHDYESFSASDLQKSLYNLPIAHGTGLDFYYAVLLDSTAGYPLFNFYNYVGSLTDNKCYVSLDPSRKNLLDVCNGTINYTSTVTYTGKARATTYKVFDQNGKELVKNTDYTVSYFNNVKPGTAVLRIKGIGNYEGVRECYFYIKPKMTALKFSSVTSNSAKLSWSDVADAYQYNIYKYNAKTKKYTFLKSTSLNYTYIDNMASACTYKYAVYPYIKAKDPYTGYTLTNSANKTLYIKGSPAVKSVTTRPLPSKFKKITFPARRTASIWWNKSARASGYKIVVSTGYKMKGVLKTYYTTATAKKITGLPSGKYVYINVIPYKTVGKVKLYSDKYYYYYAKIR